MDLFIRSYRKDVWRNRNYNFHNFHTFTDNTLNETIDVSTLMKKANKFPIEKYDIKKPVGVQTIIEHCDNNNGVMIIEVKQVEEYCLTLPPLTFETFELKMNLEHFIDELFENWLKAKYKKQEDKKLQKNFEKGICYGTLESYNIVYWSLPIRAMLVHPTGKNTLIKKIADLKAQGENILNTNLPKELL